MNNTEKDTHCIDIATTIEPPLKALCGKLISLHELNKEYPTCLECQKILFEQKESEKYI